jgi:hypothetical protein
VTVGICCLSIFMIAIDTMVVNLALPLIEVPSTGWRSPPVLAASGASGAAVVLLVGWEGSCADPLIDLRVFRGLPFSGALAITASAFACLGGFLFLTTLYLQVKRHDPRRVRYREPPDMAGDRHVRIRRLAAEPGVNIRWALQAAARGLGQSEDATPFDQLLNEAEGERASMPNQ